MDNTFVKNPFNYIGAKYKLLPQILPLFPKNIGTFVDLFGGGVHEKIANQRKDFLHKHSRQIANAYDCVCIENLNMKAMSQSLNFGKSVYDNSWGMFTKFLKYKLEEAGKRLVQVDKFFASSQLCNNCGYQNPDTKDLSIRKWTCPQCGVHHDRDINAAINIKNDGMRLVLA